MPRKQRSACIMGLPGAFPADKVQHSRQHTWLAPLLPMSPRCPEQIAETGANAPYLTAPGSLPTWSY